jgi:hypothetical protein
MMPRPSSCALSPSAVYSAFGESECRLFRDWSLFGSDQSEPRLQFSLRRVFFKRTGTHFARKRSRRRMLPRTGPFHGKRDASRFIWPCGQILGNFELTFLRHPLESFGRVLDPVLTIIAIGRQQPDHLIGAARTRSCDIAGGKVDGLSNVVFVLQRPSPSRKNAGRAHVSRCNDRLENTLFC